MKLKLEGLLGDFRESGYEAYLSEDDESQVRYSQLEEKFFQIKHMLPDTAVSDQLLK